MGALDRGVTVDVCDRPAMICCGEIWGGRRYAWRARATARFELFRRIAGVRASGGGLWASAPALHFGGPFQIGCVGEAWAVIIAEPPRAVPGEGTGGHTSPLFSASARSDGRLRKAER